MIIISIQDDIPHDSLKYYYGPISLHDKAMGGFALVNVDESTLTVTFIDYKGIFKCILNTILYYGN